MKEFKSRYHFILPQGVHHDEVEDYKCNTKLKTFNLTGLGECAIYMFEESTNIPHFHIIGDDFETAICMKHALYFDGHNNIDILTDEQVDELISALNENDPDWDWYKMIWNGANLHAKMHDLHMPNYSKLKLKGGEKNVFWNNYTRKHKGIR